MAPSLSSNWKALQSKLGGASKNAKVTKPAIKKVKATAKVIPTAKTVPPVAVVSTPEVTVNREGSAIESALWNNEREVTAEDIKTAPLRQGRNDGRKRDSGKYLAMDCEFVGIGAEGKESALARISIVNFYGHVVFDKFVKPKEKVVDWRTWVSGVTPKHMNDAITFEEAQNTAADLLNNKILVGHAISHDLDALLLSHPRYLIRDTSSYKPFREIAKGRTPSLKNLSSHFLKVDIQGGSHSSVEDARATMLLFRLYKKDFEESMRPHFRK
ncbi:RNA exonuclease 4 [[Candida] anglica]